MHTDRDLRTTSGRYSTPRPVVLSSSLLSVRSAGRLLFRATGLTRTGISGPLYDVTPDGQRFLVKREVGSSPIHVVLNWDARVERECHLRPVQATRRIPSTCLTLSPMRCRIAGLVFWTALTGDPAVTEPGIARPGRRAPTRARSLFRLEWRRSRS